MSRHASGRRETNETQIELDLELDGRGQASISSGIGFLDHLLTHVAVHGLFDLTLTATGDTHVDDHHTVEDIGIVLGQAFRTALGDKAGIRRYGDALLPMDEALVLVAVDCSGRGLLTCEVSFPSPQIGTFDTELFEEFLRALAHHAGLTLHVRALAGRNSHHIAEAVFKGLGRALRVAVELDPARAGIPSTKGTLE